MRRFPHTVLLGLLLFATSLASALAVDLTLSNTEPMLDSDSSTPLQGTASSGDLVQLIFAGANNVPDEPSSHLGTPGGDDTLFASSHNPTFIGAGTLDTDTGLFIRSDLTYDASDEGAKVYVRFWNAATAPAASHYGETAVVLLPEADEYGLAELDVVPTTGSPRATTTAAPEVPMTEVPTLSEWGMILLAVVMLGWGVTTIASRQPAYALNDGRRG